MFLWQTPGVKNLSRGPDIVEITCEIYTRKYLHSWEAIGCQNEMYGRKGKKIEFKSLTARGEVCNGWLRAKTRDTSLMHATISRDNVESDSRGACYHGVPLAQPDEEQPFHNPKGLSPKLESSRGYRGWHPKTSGYGWPSFDLLL